MKKIIEEHFKDNYVNYFTLSGITLIGVILGIIYTNSLNSDNYNFISSYMIDFISRVKDIEKIDYRELLFSSIKNYGLLCFFIIILGFSCLGKYGISCIVGYKGFSIGYSIASSVAVLGTGKGLALAGSLILLSEIVYLPVLFLLSIVTMREYKEIVNESYDDKKKLFIRYVFFLFFICVFIVFSCLIKTFISSNLFLLIAKKF